MASSFDLVSSLKPSWLKTNRRGRPGKSIVVFQGESVSKPVLSTKRKLEIVEIADDARTNPNPNCSPKKAIVLVGESCCDKFLDKGKVAMAAQGSSESSESAGSKKFTICRSCHEEMKPYLTTGRDMEEKPRGNEEAKRRPRKMEDCVKEDRMVPKECPWCKKVFANRFAVSGHSQSCNSRKRASSERPMVPPAAAGRNFDLNRLPLEAFYLPDIVALLRQT